ncbi:MAG TPA: pilus assembly protein N-terminal domain-containing protein, partial [Candidatus Sulfotelmatobacter sp.]|nr:pilus assembly protein N-terminal domain-containing protein [Candidatus Sulfotelmatobacter sp.]
TVVLIANPDIADVVLEQGHILFVLGKHPGETRLFVYDNNGNRLLERDVVVVPENERAVTVTRAVDPTEYSCDPRCVASKDSSSSGGGGKPATSVPVNSEGLEGPHHESLPAPHAAGAVAD